MVDSPYPEIQRQSNLEKMPSLMRTCHSFPRIKTFRITKIITTPNSGLFFERSLSWLVVDNTAGIGSTVSMMKWSLYSTIWILDRVPRLVRIRPKNKVNKSYEIVPLIMYFILVENSRLNRTQSELNYDFVLHCALHIVTFLYYFVLKCKVKNY